MMYIVLQNSSFAPTTLNQGRNVEAAIVFIIMTCPALLIYPAIEKVKGAVVGSAIGTFGDIM
jgi:hypothetical protein